MSGYRARQEGEEDSGLTHDSGVGAVGDAGEGVDACKDGADVVLVKLDGIGVCEEVIAVRGCRCPIGVCAPGQDVLGFSMYQQQDAHTAGQV